MLPTRIIESYQLPREYEQSGKKNFDQGAYAYVFFSDGVATKIFKRRHDLAENFVRMVFQSEVDAYQRVQIFPELQKITPKFYGPIRIENILDNVLGCPSATSLLADCAYQMEYIPAHFGKLGHHPRCSEITEYFATAGINYLIDASVADLSLTEEGKPEEIRVIDFSEHEYIPQICGNSNGW